MLETDERRDEQLHRRGDIMRVLRVSRGTVDKLIKRGELEVIHIGPRSPRVPQSSLAAFLARAKERE